MSTPALSFKRNTRAYRAIGADPLTGLHDRQALVRRAESLVTDATLGGLQLAALWIGLDRFLHVNQSFGHAVGDQVLRELSQRWTRAVAEHTVWGRVGGDEFVVLLCERDQAEAEQIASALLMLTGQGLELGTLTLRPSCSIGLALWSPGQSAEGLLEAADRAMHVVKQEGGGHCSRPGVSLQRGASGRLLVREELEIEDRIHQALEEGGLSLHFQPVLFAADYRLEGVEALMRCEVMGQPLMPKQLIPVAEKTGLIGRLGEWSLLAAAQFVQRRRLAQMPLKVAVNVSHYQISSPRFGQVLHAALTCSDAPASLIELELSESLATDKAPIVRRNLQLAREAGFRIAIDDFGTGYSCLANLKDLPVSKLKLDRAFVRDLPRDRRALAVVRLVVQLGHDFGLSVVAEGVETAAQVECLADAGVEIMQGHYFATAMNEAALLDWLKAGRLG